MEIHPIISFKGYLADDAFHIYDHLLIINLKQELVHVSLLIMMIITRATGVLIPSLVEYLYLVMLFFVTLFPFAGQSASLVKLTSINNINH